MGWGGSCGGEEAVAFDDDCVDDDGEVVGWVVEEDEGS